MDNGGGHLPELIFKNKWKKQINKIFWFLGTYLISGLFGKYGPNRDS